MNTNQDGIEKRRKRKEKKKKKRREKNQSALYIQHCSQDCYNLLRISFGTFVFYPESHSTKNHSTRCDGNGKYSFFKTSFSLETLGEKKNKTYMSHGPTAVAVRFRFEGKTT